MSKISSSSPPPDEKKFVDSKLCTYGLSVLAAITSEIFTYPMDLIKTRMQVQGEIANTMSKVGTAPYSGMVETGINVVNQEGFFKLWNGMSAVLLRQTIYSGIRITVYQWMRENFFKIKQTDKFPLWQSVVSGAVAGGSAQFFATPADYAKIHLQMEGKRRLMGEKARASGLFHVLCSRYVESGIFGLWKGVVPNTQRAILTTIGMVAGYDISKRFILEKTGLSDGTLVQVMASINAGFFTAILSTPADVVRTRIMNQPFGKDGQPLLYKNTIDCVTQTIKNEGTTGLYKGFIPVWLRQAPWALVFWISFEKMKKLIGASQF